MKRYSVLLALALVALAAVFVTGHAALAQTDDTTFEVEIVGTIESMDSVSITVNGLLIDISLAELNTPLVLDTLVKVEGVLQEDGTILAREVDSAEGELSPDELELIGTLQAISLVEATINTLAFDISTAEVDAALQVGELVKVHVSRAEDGTWVARQLARFVPEMDDQGQSDDGSTAPVMEPGEDFKITGTLDEISPDGATITVGSQVFDVTSAEIEDVLVVGALVRVEARLINGIFVASEVERSRDFFDTDDNANANEDNGNANDNDNELNNNDDDDNENENDDNGNANEVLSSGDCTVTQPQGWTVYRVRRGDTLSAIASGSGSTVSELAAVNCIANARFIRVGQALFVPRTPTIVSANVNSNDDDFNDNGDDDNFNDNDDDHNDNDDDDNFNDNEDNHNDNDDDDSFNGNEDNHNDNDD
ncbi:MAG: hypothetical protein Kow0077_02950 [Anaerolineae bacterium]